MFDDRQPSFREHAEALRLVEEMGLGAHSWLIERRRRGPSQQRCVIRELRQRVHGLALAREAAHACVGKYVPHPILRCRYGDGMAVSALEGGEVGGKSRHVVAGARDRQADKEKLALRIVADDRQHGAEELRIAEQRAGDVDRIVERGECRQHAFQPLFGLSRDLRQWDALALGVVRRHDAARARVADEDQALAARPAPAEIELRGRNELLRIVRAPDAVALEKRVDHAILGRERTGVRARGFLATCRAAGLQRHDRHIALFRHLGRGR